MFEGPFGIFEFLIILYAIISLVSKFIKKNSSEKIDKTDSNITTYKNNLNSKDSKNNFNTGTSVDNPHDNTSVKGAILSHTILNNHFINNTQNDSCNDSCNIDSGCDCFDGGSDSSGGCDC